MQNIRKIERIIKGQLTSDGAGVKLTGFIRPIPDVRFFWL